MVSQQASKQPLRHPPSHCQHGDICLHAQGTLPDSLGRLTNLKQIILSSNVLTGSLPAYVGAYPGVSDAWLEWNNLSGRLSTGLCSNPAGRDILHLQARHLKSHDTFHLKTSRCLPDEVEPWEF